LDKTLAWLLDKEQPSVRYYALKELLNKSDSDPDVKEAHAQITERGWASSILREQLPDGYWVSDRSLYHPKYSATNWKLIVLADLGLTAKDPGVRKTCEIFLQIYPSQTEALEGRKQREGTSA